MFDFSAMDDIETVLRRNVVVLQEWMQNNADIKVNIIFLKLLLHYKFRIQRQCQRSWSVNAHLFKNRTPKSKCSLSFSAWKYNF